MALRFAQLLLLALLCGCGPVSYTLDIAAAERTVAAARADNAGYYAPYELSFAQAHLEKAHEEAARGAYEDALRMAEIAERYGRRAHELSQGGGP